MKATEMKYDTQSIIPFRITIFLVACLVVATMPSHAAVVAITASQDAHVESANPNTNFGSEIEVNIEGHPDTTISGGESSIAFFSFDISSVTETVTAVDFIVRLSGGRSDRSRQLWAVTDESLDSWTEGGITWNNAPGVQSTVGNALNGSQAQLVGAWDSRPGVRDDGALTGLNFDVGSGFGVADTDLVNFVNTDTNNILTFAALIPGNNGVVFQFISKDNTGGAGFEAPTLSLTTVPEPSTYILLAIGSLILSVRFFRKQN
ncbi:MAG: DNRLRE domain-containing protein [Verrucomicrobiota bacterium]